MSYVPHNRNNPSGPSETPGPLDPTARLLLPHRFCLLTGASPHQNQIRYFANKPRSCSRHFAPYGEDPKCLRIFHISDVLRLRSSCTMELRLPWGTSTSPRHRFCSCRSHHQYCYRFAHLRADERQNRTRIRMHLNHLPKTRTSQSQGRARLHDQKADELTNPAGFGGQIAPQ